MVSYTHPFHTLKYFEGKGEVRETSLAVTQLLYDHLLVYKLLDEICKRHRLMI